MSRKLLVGSGELALVSLDGGLESSSLILEDLEVLLFLGDEHLEVHGLGITGTWEWTDNLWLFPDGTSEHLVRPVELLLLWGDEGIDLLGDVDDLLESDELLVDLGHLLLVDDNLFVDLVDLSGDHALSDLEDINLLGELLDELLNSLDLLGAWLGDSDSLVDSGDLVDLDDIDVDDLLDVGDLSLEDGDLLSEDIDLLDEDWGLLRLLLDVLSDDGDLLVDVDDLSGDIDNLGDVLNDDLSGGGVLLLDWLWLEARVVGLLDGVQLALDDLDGSLALFPNSAGLDLGAHLVDLGDVALENGDGLSVLLVLSASEDGDEELGLSDLDLSNDLLLGLDEGSVDLDLVDDLGDLLLEDGDLLGDLGLLGLLGDILDLLGELDDLSSDDDDLLDELSDDDLSLDDDLLDLSDLGLLLLGEDWDWGSSDLGDLLSNVGDSLSNLGDLDVEDLEGLSVLGDLWLDFLLLGWGDDDLLGESSDSSSDDGLLDDQLVDSDVELLDNGSVLDELLLDWSWSQTGLAWSLEP